LPEDILAPIRAIYGKVEAMARILGETAPPASVQEVAVPREQLEIEVEKAGRGLKVIDSRIDQKGREASTAPSKFKAIFPEGL
jgi:hypothetical protein